MSFEHEWAQHKANAASSSDTTSTRLNQATTPDASPTGGTGWLVVKDDDLGKVGHAAFRLHGGLKKHADVEGTGTTASDGRSSSARAATHLTSHSFLLGKALSRTAEIWNSQLKTVLQGCAHISNHLDYSKSSHRKEDEKIGGDLMKPSKISRLLD